MSNVAFEATRNLTKNSRAKTTSTMDTFVISYTAQMHVSRITDRDICNLTITSRLQVQKCTNKQTCTRLLHARVFQSGNITRVRKSPGEHVTV